MTLYRKARIEDVEPIYQLVMGHAQGGTMLPRSRQSLYEGIREYVVAVEQNEIIAVGALRILWSDLAEIRSLVVRDGRTRQGIGQRIVELLEEEAKALGLPQVFAPHLSGDLFHAVRIRKDF